MIFGLITCRSDCLRENRHSVGERRSVIVHRVPHVHRAPKVLWVSVKSMDETRRRVISRAARQAFIHGSTTKHKASLMEITTSFQYGKHGIEIRIWSVGQDNSQSWVRISYGTNKYVIDSNQNNTEALADPHEDQTSQTSVKVIAARSKAKAKPQKRELVDVPSIIPMHERKWIDIEPAEPSLCIRSIEESDQSSSTQSNSTAGRRWSNSILEN